MSLFVLSSKDGWVDIMYHGLDAVGIDMQVEYFIMFNQYFSQIFYSQNKIIMSGDFFTLYPSCFLSVSLSSTCLLELSLKTSTDVVQSKKRRKEQLELSNVPRKLKKDAEVSTNIFLMINNTGLFV